MTNKQAHFAEEFALNTSQSFFLTGKAGTGKTTLLKKILTETSKNTIVVAPTGVAAINAGGVTIHSMFGLPLTSFIPNNDFVDLNLANNRSSLKRHMRFRKEKRKLFQELDLLIIDEISMVRADLLDAIDFILQEVRQNQEAFGGLQVIFIGDLYQLPPVVKEQHWQLLREYYDSPFFFDSYAWKNANAFIIELDHIYRQQDEKFIHILNNVRNGEVEEEDLEILNENYQPYTNFGEKEYITLCTHNRQADNINAEELLKLSSPPFAFKAKIEGNFNENAYPADQDIQLKVGAQVMFVRNDAEEKQYYNGKLARVESVSQDYIKVSFIENGEHYTLKEEVWENINYSLDKETNEVKQEKLGSFTQYPIRLAWAITVHKSQGLTFKKAIIDLGQTFVAGQAYVALSRCTDLEGLVLKSKINAKNIFVDERIVQFHREYRQQGNFESALRFAKEDYAQLALYKAFTFIGIKEEIQYWNEMITTKDLPEKANCMALNKEAHNTWLNLQNVEQKFKSQLRKLFRNFKPDDDTDVLVDRCNKAIHYFSEELFTKIIQPLNTHINEYAFKTKTKAYIKFCKEMMQVYWHKMHQLYSLHYLDLKIYSLGGEHDPKVLPNVDSNLQVTEKKGATFEITLEMFNNGDTVQEIAKARSMAVGTIEQHLTKWIAKGALNIFTLVDKDRVNKILAYLKQQEDISLGRLKEDIPFETSFAELRHVLAYQQWNKKAKS
jgi:GTPase SAR1 family protein